MTKQESAAQILGLFGIIMMLVGVVGLGIRGIEILVENFGYIGILWSLVVVGAVTFWVGVQLDS